MRVCSLKLSSVARWIIGSTAGGVLGWALAASLAVIATGLALLGAGVIAALFIALAQWLVIQPYFRPWNQYRWVFDKSFLDLVRWPLLSIAGAAAGWYVVIWTALGTSMLLNNSYTATIIAVFLGGAVFGAFQWWSLRQRVREALLWIPANAVGMAIGVWAGSSIAIPLTVLIFPYENRYWSFRESFLLFIEGSIGTAVFSIITAMALFALLRRPARGGRVGEDMPGR
jgi:hypothetical protein